MSSRRPRLGKGSEATLSNGEGNADVTEKTASSALQVSLAYYDAWTTQRFDEALAYIDESVVCDAPSGRFEGQTEFRGFMEPFTGLLTRSELIASFGDDETSLLMYDTDTVPVSNAPGAEYHRVQEGKITYIRIIFDRAPFDAARQASTGQ